MASEGMVDALRRASVLLDPGGIIVDVHPTPEPARLELATGADFFHLADRIDDGGPSGPKQRHAAADAALAQCVSAGLLKREAVTEFTFHTIADTVDQLLQYLETHWKQLHFAEADLQRARDELARHPRSAVAVTERVTTCRLSCCGQPSRRR